MTRDIASSINNKFGEILVLPEAKIDKTIMTIPGTDGQKMSKSYNNFINIFLPEKKLKKQVMSIVTDSTPMEDPKDPDTCNVYALYKLLASEKQNEEMRANYIGGNYGFGHAKLALFELLLENFSTERVRYDELMDDKAQLDAILEAGAAKARKVAFDVLNRVRTKVGY